MTTSDTDDIAAILVIWVIVWIALVLWALIGAEETKHQLNELANNPELKQCLSYTGAVWKDWECIIFISK